MLETEDGDPKLSWTPERQLLENNRQDAEKRVLDVNVLAIFLSRGHPGSEYVLPVVESGLRGAYVPVLMDILPLRAFWIMTHPWGLSKNDSSSAIQHFIQAYDSPQYVALRRETILNGFRLAEELSHDVSDCMYLALALQENASSIITTDTDFENLCNHTGLKYLNPVPKEILKRFKEQNKSTTSP
jgi:predicted nucleic acid-binding protein